MANCHTEEIIGRTDDPIVTHRKEARWRRHIILHNGYDPVRYGERTVAPRGILLRCCKRRTPTKTRRVAKGRRRDVKKSKLKRRRTA